MKRSKWAALPVLAISLAAGCTMSEEPTFAGGRVEPVEAVHVHDVWAGITEAVAVVHPTKGHTARGVIRFTQTADGVRVVADIEGLTPNAKHAFHIHEFGDETSPDGKSAGGHYNPGGHPHAGPDAAMRHAGDLGNLETDASGRAHYDRVAVGASIAGHRDPFVGRSVIIHVSADDFTTQPTGNAGDRIGCGVIGIAKPAAK